MNNNDLCLCSKCGRMIRTTDDPVQLPVLDFDGSLDQILLAHRECRPEWAVHDDWSGSD